MYILQTYRKVTIWQTNMLFRRDAPRLKMMECSAFELKYTTDIIYNTKTSTTTLTLAQSVVVLCNFVSNMTFTFERSRYIEAGVRATTIVHLAFIHIYSHQIIKHCRRWKHSGVNFCQQPKNSRNIAEFLSSNLMVNFSLCSSTKVWSSYCQWYKHKR